MDDGAAGTCGSQCAVLIVGGKEVEQQEQQGGRRFSNRSARLRPPVWTCALQAWSGWQRSAGSHLMGVCIPCSMQ